jgi:hypothetical protein
MGLMRAAVGLLEDPSVAFAPAEEQTPATPANTLAGRDLLLAAAGCRASIGSFPYWEWREIDAAANDVWARLTPLVDEPADRWIDRRGRSRSQIIDILNRATDDADIDGPSTLTLRPWIRPSLLRTCRVPFIPLAVLFHAWQQDGGGLADALARDGLTAETTAWELLDRIEGRIAHTPAPDGVYEATEACRNWMRRQQPLPWTSPCRFLVHACTQVPDADLAELRAWANTDTMPQPGPE